jgi:hypothetical protein
MTKVISIPKPGVDFQTSKPTLEALVEAVETGQRVRNDILKSFVKVEDLVDLGVLRLAASGKALMRFQPALSVPTFQGTWVNYDLAYEPAGFYRDAFGRVHLTGLVKSGTIGLPVFTLPAGYRPVARNIFAMVSADTIGRLDVLSSGEVTPVVGSNLWLSLAGVSFLAVQ